MEKTDEEKILLLIVNGWTKYIESIPTWVHPKWTVNYEHLETEEAYRITCAYLKKKKTDDLIQTMNDNGYIFISHSNKKNGDGYKYETIDYSHWITLMNDDKINMYSIYRNMLDNKHIYDTGILTDLNPATLDFLIKTFTK